MLLSNSEELNRIIAERLSKVTAWKQVCSTSPVTSGIIHPMLVSPVERRLHPAIDKLKWLCIAAIVVGAGLIGASFPQIRHNGLSTAINGVASLPATWLWIDAVTANESNATVTLSGVLWYEAAGRHEFEVVSDGMVEVRLNDTIVYSHPARSPMQAETIVVELPAGSSALSLHYQVANPHTPRYEVSLRENGRLIAPWRLYTAAPTTNVVQSQWLAWIGLWIGLGLIAIGSLSACGMGGYALRWSWREWAVVIGIVAAAIIARLWVVAERYNTSPDFYAMNSVWDNFVLLGRMLIADGFHLAGSYYQQGTIIYTALAQIGVGPGLWPQYALNAMLGGLASGLVLGAAWAMFGREAGLLTGLLMALYAPLIHFQTTLQIVVPATLAMSVAVALGAWLIRKPDWGAALAYGIAIGYGALCRSPLMGAAIAGPIAVLLSPVTLSRRRRLIVGLTPLLGFALAVAPMAWANAQVGVYSFTSSGFPIAFFRGNNRDTFGINEYLTEREHLARLRAGDEDNFNAETLADIRADPGHWVQLLFHKAGLFWTGQEYSDRMLDFYSTGLEHSGLLRALWLGGAFNLYSLAGLATIGLMLGHNHQTRPGLWMLTTAVVAFMLITIIFSVTGRVRTPVQPALFPLAGLGFVAIMRHLRRLRSEWRPVLISIGAATSFALVIHLLETRLPSPTTLHPTQLPATLVATNVDFDSTIKLIGFDAYDSNFKPGGYLDLTLYWQAQQPIASDYTVLLHLLDLTLERLGGADQRLGAANMPIYPASRWQPGEVIRQSYVLRLPSTESPTPIRILIALATPDGRRLPITASDVEILDGTAAIITGTSVLTTPANPLALTRELKIVAASEIAAVGTNLAPTQTIDAEQDDIHVTLGWQAITHPSYRYHLFLHLLNTKGDLITQWDGPPVPDFATDTWPPAHHWQGQYTLAIPPDTPPGLYQLIAGLYRLGSGQRLSFSGDASLILPDDRFLLATIELAR